MGGGDPFADVAPRKGDAGSGVDSQGGLPIPGDRDGAPPAMGDRHVVKRRQDLEQCLTDPLELPIAGVEAVKTARAKEVAAAIARELDESWNEEEALGLFARGEL